MDEEGKQSLCAVCIIEIQSVLTSISHLLLENTQILRTLHGFGWFRPMSRHTRYVLV